MPSNFLAEAVNTSIYLLNRLPTKSLKNKTPYEAWNVKVDEMTTWDWQNKKDAQSDVDFDNHEDFQTSKSINDFPMRDTRSLEDIYQRCSLAITEPTSYVEAKDSEA